MVDKNIEAFIMYMTFLSLRKLTIIIYPTKIVLLLIKKIKILNKYLDFLDVFFFKKRLWYY